MRGLGFLVRSHSLSGRIRPKEAFGRPPLEPIVHTWVPAAALYFDDPDGKAR